MDKPVILIVDDEHLMLNMLGGLLQEEYRVLVATSGEQALKRAKGEQTPDLILLDVVMPDMDGYQVCQQLKADARTAEIPVMFLTAKSDPQEETRGLALGAVDYVTKPITPSIVMARIERHLKLQKLKAQLEDKNASLEAEIQKRKAAQDALTLAKEQAELANEAKSSFVAHVSHEVRTPLNSVLGMLKLCVDSSDAAQRQKYIEKALHAAASMNRIIDDLLDLSRIEAGKLNIVKTDFSLQSLLNDTCELLKVSATEQSLAIRTDVCDAMPEFIRADSLRIGQVLLNLAHNALKFSHQGEVVISARYESNYMPARLVFHVKDTGIGISAEQQQDLFKPYTQVEHRKYGGTGLGLAICKELLELMGGDISVSSELGQGADFCFSVPVEQASTAMVEVSSDDDVAALKNARVLLVDDHSLNLQAASALLRREGMHVVCASSGAQAIAVLRSDNFDVILLDLHMPKMDGFETAKAIRDAGVGHAPMIAMTADLVSTDASALEKAGFKAMVGKPFDLPNLLNLLAQCVGGATTVISTIPSEAAEIATVPDSSEQFTSLTGFNISRGLVAAQSDIERYKKYLGLFRDSLAQDIEALAAAAENSDLPAYNKIIHSVKGVAPIVGASDIGAALNIFGDCSSGEIDKEDRQHLIEALQRSYLTLCTFLEQSQRG